MKIRGITFVDFDGVHRYFNDPNVVIIADEYHWMITFSKFEITKQRNLPDIYRLG